MLRGETPVQLRRRRCGASAARTRDRAPRTQPRTSLDIAPHEAALWDALRDLRARLAREQNVPAYVIFHDATLLADAARPAAATGRARRRSAASARRKLERYGEAFLGVLTG